MFSAIQNKIRVLGYRDLGEDESLPSKTYFLSQSVEPIKQKSHFLLDFIL